MKSNKNYYFDILYNQQNDDDDDEERESVQLTLQQTEVIRQPLLENNQRIDNNDTLNDDEHEVFNKFDQT